MKKQLLLTAIACASLTQASDNNLTNRLHKTASIATHALTAYSAVNPSKVADFTGSLVEKALTLNGKRNTPNFWDGTDGNSGVKSYLPQAIAILSFAKLGYSLYAANQKNQSMTDQEFVYKANNWAQATELAQEGKGEFKIVRQKDLVQFKAFSGENVDGKNNLENNDDK